MFVDRGGACGFELVCYRKRYPTPTLCERMGHPDSVALFWHPANPHLKVEMWGTRYCSLAAPPRISSLQAFADAGAGVEEVA